MNDGNSGLDYELALIQEKFEIENWKETQSGKVTLRVLEKVLMEVDFQKYPKRPTVRIPKELEKMLGKPQRVLFSLVNWDKKAPFHVVSVIEEFRNYVENLAGIKIRILRQLAEALCQHAHHYHPREFIGLLRVKGGVLAEYLLPPSMESSGTSAIFSSYRLPVDRSVIATVHSHPSGNNRPSEEDLRTYSSGTKFFNLIIGYPYTFANIACYDRRGNALTLEIVEETPFDILGENELEDGFLNKTEFL